MAEEQVVTPVVTDNVAAEGNAGKEGSLLTGEGESTTSLTDGANPTLPHAWMSGMTTEQKADADLIESVSKFEKGIPDLVKSYAELEKKQSQSISVPNEKATEEEKARYRKVIGVPDKLEDYKLDKEKLPGNLDEVFEKEYLAKAHENGLTNPQVNAVYQWYINKMTAQIADAIKVVKTTQAETEAEERKELGSGYDAAQIYKERAYRYFFPDPEIAKLFVKSGFGNHKGINRGMIEAGKLISEHPFNDGSRGVQTEGGEVGKRSFEEIASSVYPEKNQQ